MKLLAWHLGLGDAIICAGLVAKLAQKERIMVPCYDHNYESVKSFFFGLNVAPVIVKGDREVIELTKMYDSIKLGHFNNSEALGHFVTQFYEDAGLEYKERYDSCPLLDASAKVIQVKEPVRVLVCNDSSTGHYGIRGEFLKEKYRTPYNQGSILAWSKTIMSAKIIHCIDSSFLHLVEQLPDTGAKLYYHKYARPNSPDFTFKKNWNVLTE